MKQKLMELKKKKKQKNHADSYWTYIFNSLGKYLGT